MKSIKRILATVLMLVMISTLVMGTISVSAATVNCTTKLVVVDDDFADESKGATVSAVVAGTTYTGKLGSTAFATIQQAIKAVEDQGDVYVAAGVYAGKLGISKSVHLYGNQKDVCPNTANDLSEAANGRASTGKNETVLQNMPVYYDYDSEAALNYYGVTINGFAFAGDSCIYLRGNCYTGADVEITNNVFDLVNENAYDILGDEDTTTFGAITIGKESESTLIARSVSVKNNRIEKVESTGAGMTNCGGILTYWATDVLVESNYVSGAKTVGISMAQLQTTTKMIGNYVYNCGSSQIYNNIGGMVECQGNTFDSCGGSTSSGTYAMGVYSTGASALYSSLWKSDASHVKIYENNFINVGKAIYIAGRQRQSDNPTNFAPLGTEIYDNSFIPALLTDCTFVQMSYCDGSYAPPVYNNYTGGLNPKDICTIVSSDGTASFDFGSYWLDEDMTVSSDVLSVLAITNTNGVSFAAANIKNAPLCTVAVNIPAAINDITIGLEVMEGGYYELYVDEECTEKLANDTTSLQTGVNYVYAKVIYGDYSIVYTLILTKKTAYSDYLDASEYVVSSEFTQYPTGQTVYVEIGDEWRRAVIGHSAYGELAQAMNNVQVGDTIHLTAGIYEGNFNFNKGVTIKGPKAGINPNDMSSDAYDISTERSDDSQEAIFVDEMAISAGSNGLTFDGITFSDGGYIYITSSFLTNGLNFKNCLFKSANATDSFIRRGRQDTNKNTITNLHVYRCRFQKNGTSYVMRLPNVASGLFEENVFYQCNKNIYMGGLDGSATDVLEFRNNIFYQASASNMIYIGQTTDGSNDTGAKVTNSIKFDGNRLIDCTSGAILKIDRWRAGTNLTYVNNRHEGTTKSNIIVAAEPGYAGQTIVMNHNYFGSSMSVALSHSLESTADCSYNYFANGPATAISGNHYYVPYYTNAEMTQLSGDYQVTGITAPVGAVYNNEEKTITYNATTPSDTLTLNLKVSDGATYGVYTDRLCTEAVEDNKITLKGENTTAYVKVVASDGETYNIYTVTIKQPINNQAKLKGMDIEGSTSMDQGNNKMLCNLPDTYVYGPLVPVVSAGATVSVYEATDTELKNPINYNTDIDIPVGKTTYYIKVVSEDGSATEVYTLVLSRSKSTAYELLGIEDSVDEVVIDGNTLTASFANSVEKLLPVLVVSPGATYEFFKDVGGNLYADGEMTLEVGENKAYVKVTAEDGVSGAMYTLILTRLDKSSEKYVMPESFPEYAFTQEEIDLDEMGQLKGIKRIDNNNKVIYLSPNEYIESIDDSLVVSNGASYEIFADFDLVKNKPIGAALSNSASKNSIKLAEGTNTFFIRIAAMNGSTAIYNLVVLNEIKNTETELITVNGFVVTRNSEGDVITATSTMDAPQVDIFVSTNADVQVYADYKMTKLIPSTMMEYVITETKEAFTNCRLNASPAQSYTVYYLKITSQSGNVATYELRLNVGSKSASFTDVGTHWAKSYIEQAYTMGITSGNANPDGTLTFNPNNYATREQIAVFVCNLLGIDTSAYSDVKLPYKDAKKISSWAKNAVRTVYDLGIMTGDGSNFNPKANISRQEFMVTIARTCALDTSKGKASHIASFKDKGKIASWAKQYVQTVVAFGLVNGDDQGRLNPTANITRAEIVKIMVSGKDFVR